MLYGDRHDGADSQAPDEVYTLPSKGISRIILHTAMFATFLPRERHNGTTGGVSLRGA